LRETSAATVDIIVPAFNEGDRILSMLGAFDKEIRTPFRVWICYDNEGDSTLGALKSYKGRSAITLVKNKGFQAHGAVLSGFYASDAPAVISYMADDDYNARLVDQMVALFSEGCDVVCASRFMRGGSMVGCRWYKALPLRVAAFTLHHLARLPVHDPTNGFRLFSRRLLDRVGVQSSVGFTYSIELLVKCHRLGWRIGEVPAQWFERIDGGSRFRVFNWAPAYLRWYLYAYATTYLRTRL
jgi:glycosyltransferase involved in cell wall biosynthesis